MLPPGDGTAKSVGFCLCFSFENGGSYDTDIDGSCIRGCLHCKRSDPSSSSSCYSCSSLWLDFVPFKDSEKLLRIITASAKSFSIGAGLKGGLALFSIFARLRRSRSSFSSRKIELFSNKEAIAMAIKETLRYGLFLGTFAGTYVSVDEIIGSLGGHRRTARWRALLAGLIAGPAMLLTGPNTQHTSLAIYILMRAAVLALRYGIKSRRFGRICKPLNLKHGDIFLMCVSSSQILSYMAIRLALHILYHFLFKPTKERYLYIFQFI